jgi:type IV secretory pathway VirB6-like protein
MNDKPNFNNFFPTDNSAKTNLHYDLVASKFLNSIESHQRSKYYNSASSSGALSILSSIIQIGLGIILLVFASLRYIYKSLK